MPYAKLPKRRTKIICTIGPASASAAIIERLIRAGMDIARLNLSHGSYREHARYVKTIREIAKRLSAPVAILMDIPGPKYRIGKLRGGSARLKRGTEVTITARQIEGDDKVMPVNIPTLIQDVRVGAKLLLDDGAIQLKVLSVSAAEARCRVVTGGVLVQGRGIAVPGIVASTPFITDRLREHLDFAITQRPDYIALSFVHDPQDVMQTRAILEEKNCHIPIITKIEQGRAVANFDKLLQASDGIMVARGDLGVDIPLRRVPLIQKEIIKKCNRVGKPVITATQMLESMVNAARPTRAEVTDVANAIFDGTDAIMLSAETSIGKYPIPAVRMMAQIAQETDGQLPYEGMLMERSAWLEPQTDELIAYNACLSANRLGAAAIVAFTESGSTAQRVSKYRPQAPILAITSNQTVCGKVQLFWGVQAFQIGASSSVNELFSTAAKLAKEQGLARPGDLIVITGGIPLGVAGTTNLLKVERIS
ncbi:MAG TPA: pyruvate kinase [Dehalococcoidia bacterium]|jgi:pyruvate kinase|nr:pyruvate kinase [Dehalococcoidia bacterium]